MPNPPPTRRVNAATRRSASPSAEGRKRPPQVGVAEEQRARRGHPLARAQRLALPSLLEAEDDRARVLRRRGGAVRGGSVDDEDLGVAELGPQGPDRLADSLRLIAGRNEDGELSHSEPAPTSTGGATPSVAEVLDAVVAGGAAGEEQGERDVTGRGLDVVHARHALRTVEVDRRRVRGRRLDADDRDTRLLSAR